MKKYLQITQRGVKVLDCEQKDSCITRPPMEQRDCDRGNSMGGEGLKSLCLRK